jgi:hypothetical protein
MLMLIMVLNGPYFFAWAFYLLLWGGEFFLFGKNDHNLDQNKYI